MSRKVLKDYETFTEIPFGCLEVNKNSNLFYIKCKSGNFIVREKNNLVSNEGDFIKIRKSYHSVIDEEVILEIEHFYSLCNQSSVELIDDDVKIASLSSLFKINDNSSMYLYLSDVLLFIKENQKNKRRCL